MSKLKRWLKRFLPMPYSALNEHLHQILRSTKDIGDQHEIIQATQAELRKCQTAIRQDISTAGETYHPLEKLLHTIDENQAALQQRLRTLEESQAGLHDAQAKTMAGVARIEKLLNEVYLVAAKTNEANRKAKRMNLDVERLVWEQAARQSAKFVIDSMRFTRTFATKDEMLSHFVRQASADGLFLELGVYSGRTVNLMADARPDIQFYGFDSFEGLPEDWRSGYAKHSFARDDLPTVRENVTLVKGWFDAVLPAFVKEHPGPCSFIHMDCDLYSSTKTALEALRGKLAAGTYIVFDEYYNYPGWEGNEHKALVEFTQKYGIPFEYAGYVPTYEQVAVRILGESTN